MKSYKKIFSLFMAIVIIGSSAFSASAATFTSEKNINNQYVIAEATENRDTITGLTDSEAYELFQQYLTKQPQTRTVANKATAQAQLDQFAEYAAKQGIIQNTPQAKQSLSKAVVRAQFKIAAGIGRVAGYKTAAELLNHSLQDSPSSKSYKNGSSVSNQIKNSKEFKTIMTEMKRYARSEPMSRFGRGGSTTLNSTTDLHLAFNKVSYFVNANKAKNGKWTVSVAFSDRYDFDTIAWKSAGNKVVTIINNYAVAAQQLKAIVPYNVSVVVVDTFYE